MHAFFGGGGISIGGGIFHVVNFLFGGKFPGDELVKRNYTLGEFARIPIGYKILFIGLAFFLLTQVYLWRC